MDKKIIENILLFVMSALNFLVAILAIVYDAGPFVQLNVIIITIFIILQLLGDRYG